MSISGSGRRGFLGWDKKKRTSFNLHRSIKPSNLNETSKLVWGDWFWLTAAAVVVPSSGKNLSFRHAISSSKLVGETVTMYFNFSDQAPFGETLSTPVCTSVVISGTDDAPEDMIFGAAVIEDTYVSQQVTLGLPGVIYNIICTVQGESSHVYQVKTCLAVLNNEGSFGYGRGLSIEGELPDTYAYSTYYETLDIINGYVPFGPVTVFSGNYPIGWTPTVVDRYIVTSGIANDTGTFTFTYKLRDFAGQIAYSTQQVYIPPVDIYGSIPAVGFVGTAYSGHYDSQYGMPPYSYTTPSGTPIPGVTINASTSYYTGNPTTAGTYTFTTRVTDDIDETDDIEATVEIFTNVAPIIVTTDYAYYGTPGSLATLGNTSGITYGTTEYLPSWGIGGYIATNDGTPGGARIYRPNVTTGVFDNCTLVGGQYGDVNCISLDGNWVVTCGAIFTTQYDYYVYQRTGLYEFTLLSGPHTVTDATASTVMNMRFSPDMQYMAMTANESTGSSNIFVHRFNSTTGALTVPATDVINVGTFTSSLAVFSPSSKLLACITDEPSPNPGELRVFSIPGGTLVGADLTHAGSGNRTALCWSNDGRFIYANSDRNGGAWSISLFDVTTAGAITFNSYINEPNIVASVDMHPAGTYLLSHSYDTGNLIVYSMNSSTGALTLIETKTGGNRWASWVYYS